MNDILIPVLTLSGLGLIFGVGLAIAAKKLSIAVDPKVEKVFSKLAGANCGACGMAGCMGFAESLVHGAITIDKCTVIGPREKSEIASLLGVEVKEKVKTVAVLHCCGGKKAKDKFKYDGIKDCNAANLIMGGQKACTFGCLSFGTCAKACAFGAIKMDKQTGLPVVDESRCTACGNCVKVCPKQLFSLVPAQSKIYIACNSRDVGKVVMQVCGVGCIACKKCEKACTHQAITIVDNLAVIDYSKCNGCLECVAVCPTKVIKQRG
jgi:Na+-translocating ferredoxin:NAD+ oxidoreductase RNF subunit RnfB